jgi:hypothetical protein
LSTENATEQTRPSRVSGFAVLWVSQCANLNARAFNRFMHWQPWLCRKGCPGSQLAGGSASEKIHPWSSWWLYPTCCLQGLQLSCWSFKREAVKNNHWDILGYFAYSTLTKHQSLTNPTIVILCNPLLLPVFYYLQLWILLVSIRIHHYYTMINHGDLASKTVYFNSAGSLWPLPSTWVVGWLKFFCLSRYFY